MPLIAMFIISEEDRRVKRYIGIGDKTSDNHLLLF